jgi:hypothetical protein
MKNILECFLGDSRIPIKKVNVEGTDYILPLSNLASSGPNNFESLLDFNTISDMTDHEGALIDFDFIKVPHKTNLQIEEVKEGHPGFVQPRAYLQDQVVMCISNNSFWALAVIAGVKQAANIDVLKDIYHMPPDNNLVYRATLKTLAYDVRFLTDQEIDNQFPTINKGGKSRKKFRQKGGDYNEETRVNVYPAEILPVFGLNHLVIYNNQPAKVVKVNRKNKTIETYVVKTEDGNEFTVDPTKNFGKSLYFDFDKNDSCKVIYFDGTSVIQKDAKVYATRPFINKYGQQVKDIETLNFTLDGNFNGKTSIYSLYRLIAFLPKSIGLISKAFKGVLKLKQNANKQRVQPSNTSNQIVPTAPTTIPNIPSQKVVPQTVSPQPKQSFFSHWFGFGSRRRTQKRKQRKTLH